jgi:hypothetical protein
MENNIFYVYAYFYKQSMRPFYIGKGRGDRYEIKKHDAKRFRTLRGYINNIGIENIKICFLNKNLSEDMAFIWESYWIKIIGRKDLKEGPLLNFTNGGEGHYGRVASPETRLKISKALTGKTLSEEHKIKISNSWEHRVVSDETKKKLSNTLKGKKKPEGFGGKLKEILNSGDVLDKKDLYWKRVRENPEIMNAIQLKRAEKRIVKIVWSRNWAV